MCEKTSGKICIVPEIWCINLPVDIQRPPFSLLIPADIFPGSMYCTILILVLCSLFSQTCISDSCADLSYTKGISPDAYAPDWSVLYTTAEHLSLNNPNRWMILGEQEMQAGNYIRAEQVYRGGLNVSKKDSNLLHALGLSLISQDRYTDAIEPITEAIVEKKHASPFYLNLGTAYALRENYTAAIENYQKAVLFSPLYLLAWENLGLAYLKNHEGKEAIEAYITSLTINPDNPVTWINLGHALSLKRHYHEAESAFVYALTLHPAEADRIEAEDALCNITQKLLHESRALDCTSADRISQAQNNFGKIHPPVIYPTIIPLNDPAKPAEIPVRIQFGMGGSLKTVSVTVNQSLFLGAKAAYKGVLYNIDPPEYSRDIKSRFYESFINEPYHQSLITSIHDSLQMIQVQDNNITSFLEIAAVFARSLETYASFTEVRYPSESIVSHAGDCDDKSILLAAILLHHGYDVAIFEFPGHVAVGVKETGPIYRDSGYMIIEMTEDLPLGTMRPEYENQPMLVIPVSSFYLKKE